MLVVNFKVMLTVVPLTKLQLVASAAQLLTSNELILQSFDPAESNHVMELHVCANVTRHVLYTYVCRCELNFRSEKLDPNECK